jgi:hypothetical protein
MDRLAISGFYAATKSIDKAAQHEQSLAERTVSIPDLIGVAKTLLDDKGARGYRINMASSEYARGVCELLGRIQLDLFGQGEGSGENASAIETYINLTEREF